MSIDRSEFGPSLKNCSSLHKSIYKEQLTNLNVNVMAPYEGRVKNFSTLGYNYKTKKS